MGNWLKRLFNRLFEEEEFEEMPNKPINIRPGRFPSSQYEDQARVVHQYPKTGNFRFPLIPDDEQIGLKENEQLKERPKKQEREKFTGKNFKASDVPSPVFGFRERSHARLANSPTEQLDKRSPAHKRVNHKKPSASISAVVNEALDKHQFDNGEPKQNENDAPQAVDEPYAAASEEQSADDKRSNAEVSQSKREKTAADSVGSISQLREEHALGKQDQETEPVNVLAFPNKHHRMYFYPKLSLLDQPLKKKHEESSDWLNEQKKLLNETLKNFNVRAAVTNAVKGPAVTRFEVQPKPGVKVSKITNLSDDIKLNLSAKEIRIEAPIPGKNAIGIEVPNRTSQPVTLREILESPSFQKAASPLTAALGVDISGKPVVTDLKKMPHGLIAGATGSGKSVCINSILMSILYKASPDDVKFMLIDPKVVELAPYNELPHLVAPVITDVKEATAALKWAVDEMEERYKKFADKKVRDIERYNEHASEKMPYIVIIIDELADLMMVSPQEVEDAICRIAQKARACGIHLLVATQRPSVDVITGLIKANIPTRIAFAVSSQADSRTILDTGGAEKLLGKGDMLFLENGSSKPIRLQGNFVSDDEIERIANYIKKQREPNYLIESADFASQMESPFEDELFYDACEFIFEQGAASSSSLQRRFRIGYNRAARLIDMMEDKGLISKANGSKPRKLLMTKQEFKEKMMNES